MWRNVLAATGGKFGTRQTPLDIACYCKVVAEGSRMRVVVDLEDRREIVGMFVRFEEDAVIYERLNGSYSVAPGDCVVVEDAPLGFVMERARRLQSRVEQRTSTQLRLDAQP